MGTENSELEEKQAEQFTQVVGEYYFEVTAGGITSEPSPVLQALKPGIDLHFYRYGLFPDRAVNNKELTFFTEGGEPTQSPRPLKPEGAPDVDGFFYGRANLYSGYLYIINAGNPDLWYEYEVDEFGGYHPVYWRDNKKNGKYTDIRISDKARLKSITFKQDTELWVAYSPVQWSVDYYHLMRTNEDRRTQRMLKIKCTGFKKDEEPENDYILPYNKMSAAFWSEQTHYPIWYNDNIETSHVNFLTESKKDSDAIKDDMFITLHDPVGCALEVNLELGKKNIDFRALVTNIQTGQDINTIKEHILNSGQNGDIAIAPISDAHQSLFSLALACYQMVYSSKEITKMYDGGAPDWHFSDTHFPEEYAQQEKADSIRRANRIRYNSYGNGYAELGRAMLAGSQPHPDRITKGYIGYGLDRQKVEGILGVKDRKKLRQEVLEIRNELGNFLNSVYCKKIFDDYLHNIEDYKLDGMEGMGNVFMNLFVSPYDVDNHLLLNKDRVKKDKWKNWIYRLIDEKPVDKSGSQTGIKSKTPGYENSDPLHALMSAGLNFEHTWENRLGTEVKLAGFTSTLFGFMTQKAFDLKEIDGRSFRNMREVKEFVVKKLQTKFKYKGSPVYLLRKSEMYAQLNAFGDVGAAMDKNYVKIAPYNGRKDWLRIYQNSENVTVEIEGDTRLISMPVEYDVELSPRDVKLNKLNQKAAKVLNSRSFTGAIAGLQMLNMYAAVTGFDGENIEKSTLNTVGVTADLTEAILNVQKARLVAQGIEVGSNHGLVKWAGRFGAIGGFATAGMCVWDAVDSFNNLDTDAGLAWAGAGVAYGVATVMTTFCSGLALAGPIGLIAAGLGLGLVVLANLLTDTELEYYFKHFLLSDRVAFPKKESETPGMYAHRILMNEIELMGKNPGGEDLNTIMEPYAAQLRLWDLMVCTQMLFKPKDYSTFTAQTGMLGEVRHTTTSYKYHTFNVEMSFMQFLDIDSNIETRAFLYMQGIKYGGGFEISTGRDYAISMEPNKAGMLSIHLVIPGEYRKDISVRSDILFTVRINGTSNQPTFPFNNHGKERYLGARANLGSIDPFFGINQTIAIKINTLAKLKEAATWE